MKIVYPNPENLMVRMEAELYVVCFEVRCRKLTKI